MDATAKFAGIAFEDLYALTVTPSSDGRGSGTVTSQSGLSPPISCTITAGVTSGACKASYARNTSVVLTPTAAGTTNTFLGWSGSCTNTSGTCIVTMTGAQTATANFEDLYSLTVTAFSGSQGSGTVTSQSGLSPAINCSITDGVASGTCSASYARNTSVILTPAASGTTDTFLGWSGPCTNTSGTCTVTMTAAQTATANFEDSYTLTVTALTGSQGTGSVTSQSGLSPAINCTITDGVTSGTCSGTYVRSTQVILTPAPDGGTNAFLGWSGPCTNTNGTCTVTVTAAQTATANFEDVYTLTVTALTGSQGTGSVASQSGLSPAISCTITDGVTSGTCEASYARSISVILTPTATGTSNTFLGWSGACTNTSGTCAVTITAPQTATANFEDAYTLTVTALAGSQGTGSVTSQSGLSPAISCTITDGLTSGICSERYARNNVVTLTSTATGTTNTFLGWSGACTNTSGTCPVTMTAAQTATANFEDLYTLTVTAVAGGRGSGTVTSQSGLSPTIDCIITDGTAPVTGCTASYLDGTSLTLSVTAGNGSTFGGWAGACLGTGTTCAVTLDATKSTVVSFVNDYSTTLPTLVRGLRGSAEPLPAEIRRHVDGYGNANGRYDIGDLVAWLDRTGTPITPGLLRLVSTRNRP